jgi:hypothetical protein
MEQVEFARDGPRERDTYGQRRIGCVRSIDSDRDRSRTQHVVRVDHGNRTSLRRMTSSAVLPTTARAIPVRP